MSELTQDEVGYFCRMRRNRLKISILRQRRRGTDLNRVIQWSKNEGSIIYIADYHLRPSFSMRNENIGNNIINNK